MKTIRVAIADDHHMVRQMLVTTLGGAEDIEVLAEACNGQEAVELCRKFRPHVLVLDLNMPGKNGVEVTRELTSQGVDTSVLILTAVEEEAPLFESLAAGARGYLLKDASVEELVQAVRTVANGKAVLHPRSTLSLLNEFQKTRMAVSREAPDYEEAIAKLTPREREVLALIGKGLSNREIGEHLIISEKTAKTHVANLLRRVGVKDRVAAAIYAVRAGLCE